MGSKLSYIPTSLLLEINYRRLGVIFCKALKRWLKVYHQQQYLKTENCIDQWKISPLKSFLFTVHRCILIIPWSQKDSYSWRTYQPISTSRIREHSKESGDLWHSYWSPCKYHQYLVLIDSADDFKVLHLFVSNIETYIHIRALSRDLKDQRGSYYFNSNMPHKDSALWAF